MISLCPRHRGRIRSTVSPEPTIALATVALRRIVHLAGINTRWMPLVLRPPAISLIRAFGSARVASQRQARNQCRRLFSGSTLAANRWPRGRSAKPRH